MKPRFIKMNFVLSFLVLTACGGGIVKDVPTNPDTASKYIFYLHGSVEESEGSTEKYKTAVHEISKSSATVISEIREETNPNSYADKLKKQVDTLIAKGVPAKNITISGYSKGAIIALAAAGIINNQDVKFVLLAGCSDTLNEKYGVDPSNATGRILSIYDDDDEKFGSCEGIIKASNKLEFKEIVLDSGKGHKLFRIQKEKFIQLWRDPLIDWVDA